MNIFAKKKKMITNYTDKMNFAQEMMMIAESTIAIVEHFRKLQRDGFHFNITGDYHDNIVLYDSNLAGKFLLSQFLYQVL